MNVEFEEISQRDISAERSHLGGWVSGCEMKYVRRMKSLTLIVQSTIQIHTYIHKRNR
jgi:hypothetical protein